MARKKKNSAEDEAKKAELDYRSHLNNLFDVDEVELVYIEEDPEEAQIKEFDLVKLFIEAIDTHSYSFYNQYMEMEGSEMPSMVLLMNSLSSVDDRYVKDPIEKMNTQLIFLIGVNEMLNVDYYTLSKYPKLFWYRMVSVTSGLPKKKRFHNWIPLKTNNDQKLIDVMAKIFPEYNRDEVYLFIDINGKDVVRDVLSRSGVSDNEIKEALASAGI